MEEGLLNIADRCCQNHQYAPAVATYLHIARNLPHSDAWSGRARESLAKALKEWIQLPPANRDEYKLLLKGYHEAVDVFTDHDVLLSDFGGLLYRLGFQMESLTFFRRASQANPDNILARMNADNVCGHLVERWHFRMLNDTVRNANFQCAIDSALKQISVCTTSQPVVLDIGCGTGILSMYAFQSLMKNGNNIIPPVYGCEVSHPMYQLAVDILADCQLSTRIKVINKLSKNLRIPEDIPSRVHLVVTETFDCALLGEHIMCTLSHAWNSLLLQESSLQPVIIPGRATVYISAVRCDSIRLQTRYVGSVANLKMDNINIISTLFSSTPASSGVCFCAASAANFSDVGESQQELEDRHKEPYSSAKLQLLRHGFQLLSDPIATTMHFNFNCKEEVLKYASCMSDDLSIQITASGRLDALVVWFDLHLYGDHRITTSPLTCDEHTATCWEQAVYPVLSTDLAPQGSLTDVFVSSGDNLHVKATVQHTLTLKCVGLTTRLVEGNMVSTAPVNSSAFCGVDEQSEVNRQVVFRDTQLDNRGVKTKSSDCVTIFVPSESVSYLNDSYLTECLLDAFQHAVGHVQSKVQLVVLSNNVPLFVIRMLLLMGEVVEKVCFVGLGEVHRELVKQLFQANNVDTTSLRVDFYDVDSIASSSNDYNFIYVDLVDSCGGLQENILQDLASVRSKLLSTDCSVIPRQVKVYGQLINSTSLLQDSTVTTTTSAQDAELKPRSIAHHVNKLRTTHHYDIESSTLPCSRLSEPVLLLTLNLRELLADNGLLSESCRKLMSNEVTVTATGCGPLTAVLYWFVLSDDCNMCDCEQIVPSINTRDSKGHWTQAAVLYFDEIFVSQGHLYDIVTRCEHSFVTIDLTPVGT